MDDISRSAILSKGDLVDSEINNIPYSTDYNPLENLHYINKQSTRMVIRTISCVTSLLHIGTIELLCQSREIFFCRTIWLKNYVRHFAVFQLLDFHNYVAISSKSIALPDCIHFNNSVFSSTSILHINSTM